MGIREIRGNTETTVAPRRIMRTSSLRRVAWLYLRGHRHCPWAIPPRSYCHPTQPKYNQILPKSSLSAIFFCICAFFFVLRTPPVGKQFLSRYARTNFPTFPRNYGRTMQPILQTLVLFQKSVCPVIPPYCLLASELTVSNKAE